MFLKRKMNDSTGSYSDKILQIKEKIRQADTVIVGAGAGLSTAAGFVYTGDRFTYYFSDFEKKYGFSDMYSGGFYPYSTLEEHWAYWSRYIYINRYMDAPKPVYQNLYELVKEKDYFIVSRRLVLIKTESFIHREIMGCFNVANLAIRKLMTMKKQLKK